MPRQIHIKTARSLSLRALHGLTATLVRSPRPASLAQTERLLASAQAIRHTAHLERTFAAWLPSLDARERSLVEALLAGLTLQSAEEGNGLLDDHGGWRGEILYTLKTPARTISIRHFFGRDNDTMTSSTNLTFEEQSAPPSPSVRARKSKPQVRIFLQPPTNLAPAAAALFKYLGASELPAREQLDPPTQTRFLMRLLYPWGRYQYGYGIDKKFFSDADHLYTLPPRERARVIESRADDGEVIPFFLG